MNFLLKKKWNIAGRIEVGEGSGATLLDNILQIRGISSKQDREDFLHPELKVIHDPFLLHDMETACRLIQSAVADKKKILIFGDYDVDGVTSTSILLMFLRRVGAEVSFLIPDRLTEGYGLSPESNARIIATAPALVITVDNGISAIDEIAALNNAGIVVVVTDHHECKEVLPPAAAIIDPKRPDSAYPFSGLAGVGVALKLIQALSVTFDIPDAWIDYIGICALGTVGDMVPVFGENRAIIHQGLIQINDSPHSGIMVLFNKASASPGPVNAGALGYLVAPRINAAGRMGDSTRAVYLLTEDDDERRDRIADELLAENTRRQEVELSIFEEAKEMIRSGYDFTENEIIVVYKKGWHPGVLGIVASRLAEHYSRTVIVFGGEESVYKGSARSGDSISVLEAIEYASVHVLRFGGHKKAAGLAVEEDKMQQFISAVQEFSREFHGANPSMPEIRIDYEIPVSFLTEGNVTDLLLLEPFGEGNPQPVFMCGQLKAVSISGLSGGRHTKLLLQGDGMNKIEAVAFGMQTNILPFSEGDMIDIAFTVRINEWRGARTVQAITRDLRKTAETISGNEPETQQIIEKLFADDPSSAIDFINGLTIRAGMHLPGPDDFGPVYKFLLGRFSYEPVFCDTALLSDIIMSGCNLRMGSFKLNRMLDVFFETGLLELRRISPSRCIFRIIQNVNRVSLSESKTYKSLCAK
ncbi:MAG: single-stranded-DNA-specific exonuclease RecJ [Saccharofermentanales bacterium]